MIQDHQSCAVAAYHQSATEHTSSVPEDVCDGEEDSRSIDSASDDDSSSIFSGDMDVAEQESDTTSASAMNTSAKPVKADTVQSRAQAAPQLTAERLKEYQAWQDFVRAIHKPATPGAQRYMIFSDGYMWARNWREMENVGVGLLTISIGSFTHATRHCLDELIS